MFQRCVRLACLALIAWATLSAPVRAAGLDPSIATYILPQDIKWVTNAAGTNQTAVLYGDPAKPGLDGAKAEDVIIEVHGMGPATSTPAERR